MSALFMFMLLLGLLVAFANVDASSSFGGDRVRLNDVKVLTLHHNRMTTARRTYPIEQLKCIGGTAGCRSFVPTVVQCTNKGSDGIDVQWECKADMDKAYKFGTIEVVCEGYEYAEDPYILKGSCGLEYTVDRAKGGFQPSNSLYDKNSGGLGNMIMLVVVCVLIYAFYKTCISVNQYSSTDGNPPPPYDPYASRGSGFFGSGGMNQPPPAGFRPEYSTGDGCSGSGRGASSGSEGGGFWTGAATGGLLGYMFGRGNSGYGNTGYGNTGFYAPTPSSWQRSSSGFNDSSFSSGGSGGGTATSTGFGGTRRR